MNHLDHQKCVLEKNVRSNGMVEMIIATSLYVSTFKCYNATTTLDKLLGLTFRLNGFSNINKIYSTGTKNDTNEWHSLLISFRELYFCH